MSNTINRPTYTPEQRQAWKQAKELLKSKIQAGQDTRPLHIAMSLLRGKTREEIETPSLNPNKREARASIDRWSSLEAKIQEWLEFFHNPGKKKLFIFVDTKSLTPAQRAVQAAHCAALFQKIHPHAPWVNGTLILLDKHSHPHGWGVPPGDYVAKWHEPDMDNLMTACAVLKDFQNEKIGEKFQLMQ